MANLQAYLQRPRGAGERASSVPAHREDQSPGTKPAQWDPWGGSLPQSRDLSGTRKNGTSSDYRWLVHHFLILFMMLIV